MESLRTKCPSISKTNLLDFVPRHQIKANEYTEVNCFLTRERLEEKLAKPVFKFLRNITPCYVNDLFGPF